MSGSNANEVAVPLLEAAKAEELSSDHDGKALSNKRAVSIRANSFCLPTQSGRVQGVRTHRLQSFQRTVQVLQLDHSHFMTSMLSWIIGLLLVVAVPVLRLYYVRASSGNSSHELVFQPFSVVVGVALSTVSFIFLTQAIRRYGLRGVLFLDAAEEEVMEVQKDYDTVIEQCRILLAKLFLPALLVYVVFKAWFFTEVDLEPLPFEKETTWRSLTVIIVPMSLSWVFQTTTYLYSCILFSIVCSLQELKMLKFKALLVEGFDPEFYFTKYGHIVKGLRATSHRFRAYLGLIFFITIVGFLASMYKVVQAERAGIATLMAGGIVVLNWVNLSGVGLCLKSSSKLSHLHRRVVKAAAHMHAELTFQKNDLSSLPCSDACNGSTTDIIVRFGSYFENQDACQRRLALVNYLQSTAVGISVYGFVLDRFFIHASVGVIMTTTWFILGRSLND